MEAGSECGYGARLPLGDSRQQGRPPTGGNVGICYSKWKVILSDLERQVSGPRGRWRYTLASITDSTVMAVVRLFRVIDRDVRLKLEQKRCKGPSSVARSWRRLYRDVGGPRNAVRSCRLPGTSPHR